MISEVNARRWLDVAYEQWLRGSIYTSNLREPTQRMVDQMHEAARAGRNAAAEHLMRRLQELSSRFGQDQTGRSKEHFYELAETLAECGRATYLMGEKLIALELFAESSQKFIGNDHCFAALLWMLGCVQWQYETKEDDAIVSWQSSLERFTHLQHRSHNPDIAKWYEAWTRQMHAALSAAISGGDQAPLMDTDWPRWPGSEKKDESAGDQAKAPPPPRSRSRASERSDVLRSFAVYASIPAGGFKASPKPLAYAEVERFCIEGEDYELHDLWGGNPVTLRKDVEHVAVHVQGNSMNRKNIKDNDYVLLRVQDNADSGDIVAVEISGNIPDDEKSSLKQFFRRDGKIVLEPKSTEEHSTFTFEENDPRLHICGVAVAVLRKLPT